MPTLSPLAFWLGLSGLLPFFAGPLWLTLSPASVPVWLDAVWRDYLAMIASFMAGTLWGFAMRRTGDVAGLAALIAAVSLMLLSWGAMLLPFRVSLALFAAVFLLLLLTDVLRERGPDSIRGYLRLRLILTAGVLSCIGWRLLL
jgi:hypothetical protein